MMKKGINIILLIFFLTSLSCHSGKDKIKPVEQFDTSISKAGNSLYPSLDEIYFRLNQLKSRFPQNIELYSCGKSSKYQHPVPMGRIHGQSPATYSILIIGGIHGDEAIGVRVSLFIMEKLLELFQQGNPILDSFQFDVIPVLNVDGYNDNSRENGNGININRNFPVGKKTAVYEPETRCVMNLVNENSYQLSIFFHSANENKYENVIRVPLEFKKKGLKAFKKDIQEGCDRFLKAMIYFLNSNNKDKPWELHSDYVNVSGIGSDWIMAPFLKDGVDDLFYQKNPNPHLSLNVELCYPKQPMDMLKILNEEREAWNFMLSIVKNKEVIPSYE